MAIKFMQPLLAIDAIIGNGSVSLWLEGTEADFTKWKQRVSIVKRSSENHRTDSQRQQPLDIRYSANCSYRGARFLHRHKSRRFDCAWSCGGDKLRNVGDFDSGGVGREFTGGEGRSVVLTAGGKDFVTQTFMDREEVQF